MLKSFLIVVFFLLFSAHFVFLKAGAPMGGPPVGGGNDPCLPFGPCWCAQNPTHPNCAGVIPIPLDTEIIFLVISGISLAGYHYFIKKRKENFLNQKQE